MMEFDHDMDGWSQGQLSSTYTNWVIDALAGNADAVTYKLIVELGLFGHPQKDDLIAALEARAFTVGDLFSAANNKTGIEPDIKDPTPSLTFTGDFTHLGTIDLSEFFTGDTSTFEWTSGNTKNTVYHYREFLTTLDLPEGYSWDGEVPEITAEAIMVGVEETNSREEGYEDRDAEAFKEQIDLLQNAEGGAPGAVLAVTEARLFVRDGDEWVEVAEAEWPAYLTIDLEAGTLTIDKNHPDLDDLLNGEFRAYKLSYEIDDGEGGAAAIWNEAFLTVTGTEDLYEGSNRLEVELTKTTAQANNATGQQALNGQFAIPEWELDDHFNFQGTLTASGLGDYDAGSEKATITGEFDKIELAGSGNSTTETLETAVGPKIEDLEDDAFDDGAIDYSVHWHQSVQDGSSVTLQLDYTYSYWA
jgi:hypothetical protein